MSDDTLFVRLAAVGVDIKSAMVEFESRVAGIQQKLSDIRRDLLRRSRIGQDEHSGATTLQ
jgi:hypothetical protein